MTTFWLLAGAMLLVALAFVLVPVLRVRKQQAEEDRTALNVASYQEHLADLAIQLKNGALNQSQYDAACTEASRELLNETEARQGKSSPLGKAFPLVLALCVPLLGVGLYSYWGASKAVSLTIDLRSEPQSIEEFIQRLETVVELQPHLLDAWFALGRAYTSTSQPEKAANAFKYILDNLEEQPTEVLANWLQVEYFANGKRWTAALQQAADKVLLENPHDAIVLGIVGIAAYETENYQTAIDAWTRVTEDLPEGSNGLNDIRAGITRAQQALASVPVAPTAAAGLVNPTLPAIAPIASQYTIKVAVDIAPEVKAKAAATDTVYIFARAKNGPPMPLAAKRITVADLPVQVALTELDAMVPNMSIAQFPELELQARISHSGQPTEGQWQSATQDAANNSKEQYSLLINQPM